MSCAYACAGKSNFGHAVHVMHGALEARYTLPVRFMDRLLAAVRATYATVKQEHGKHVVRGPTAPSPSPSPSPTTGVLVLDLVLDP